MQDRGAGKGTSYRRTASRRPNAAPDGMAQDDPPHCTFYSVGLCDQDLEVGGWATVGTVEGVEHEESGEGRDTTVLRMELTAALRSLAATQPGSQVTVYTYGQTIPHAMKSQIKKWRSAGWRTHAGQPVDHQDLWMALWDSAATRQVEWEWLRVRGARSGHNSLHSRRALDLAQAAKRRAASRVAPAPAARETAAPTIDTVAATLPEIVPASPEAMAAITTAAMVAATNTVVTPTEAVAATTPETGAPPKTGAVAATTCPHCGGPNRPQSKFCAFCGHAQAHPWLGTLPLPLPFVAPRRQPVSATKGGGEERTEIPVPVDDRPPATTRLAGYHAPPIAEEVVVPTAAGPPPAAGSGRVEANGLRTEDGPRVPVPGPVAESGTPSPAEEARRALLAECQALEVRWAALHDAIRDLEPQRQHLVAAIAGRLGDTSGRQAASWAEGLQLFVALGAHAAQLAHLAQEAAHVGDQYSRALHRMLTGLAREPGQPALPDTLPPPHRA
ncbi:MAG: hypothetical protein NVSMB65_01240 [Chloroflexota bacterium]